ncbi:MAG: cold shock domain-containing protein [Hespellia sp.]|nr:cold shock domain-containing protein [Hespellia sp.]
MGNTEKIEYGSCRHWDTTRGYGFIRTDDGRDFFAHWSDLMMEGFRCLHIGDKVSFTSVPVDGKPDKATNVTITE